MPGESNLRVLLTNLHPTLLPARYVFCSLPEQAYGAHAHLSPLASILEPEGLTLVLPMEEAEREGLDSNGVFRCIRLEVHSSLEAVGLTAAVSSALADQDISANLLAGAHHDHILVPEARADEALEVLRLLSA